MTKIEGYEGRRIILVDDEHMVRDVSRRTIEAKFEGIQVSEAESLAHLKQVVDRPGIVDAAVIDCIMPDTSIGWVDSRDHLMSMGLPEQAILYLSGLLPDRGINIDEFAPERVLRKPYERTDFTEKIQLILPPYE